MLTTIWSGGADASDIFLLIAAIVAGVVAVVELAAQQWVNALLPVAVALIALGLLAL